MKHAIFRRELIPILYVAVFLVLFSTSTMPIDTDSSANNNKYFSVGPYKVRVEINPETPKVGNNKITVWLQNNSGDPLTAATLNVVAVMPAMGSMPPMYAPAEMTEAEPGRYEGEFEPSMGGEWPLSIKIKSPAGSAEIIFDLATGRKGLRCATCGGYGDMPGSIYVDPARRQLIGITTGRVVRKNLKVTLRAAGNVTYDETLLHDVSLKFNGWIGELFANTTGKTVTKNQPLFTVYSPELLAAQEEYLETLNRIKARGGKGGHLLRAAKRRLRLWDLSEQQIKELQKRRKAQEFVAILSPANGVIIDKQIVAGSALRTGQRLLRLADLSRVWVEAQIYDYEIPLVTIGMQVKVILPEIQGREYLAKVDYVYPFMEGDTHTVRVRVVLDNADGFLRPDMYAHIHLEADQGQRLLVPESAVIYTGQSRVVFLDLGEGRLAPRKITIGQRSREWIEVLQGLNEGDVVVTSGNFLIAAESKLKAGVDQW